MKPLTTSSSSSFFFFLLSSFCIISFFFVRAGDAADDGTDKGLAYGFYDETCPNAEKIVSSIARNRFMVNRDLPAGLLRIYFHDCFVRGCDASLLLEKCPKGINITDIVNVNVNDVEKYSPANNQTLRGTGLIDEIKSALETACPSTVSCADIITFAARDATAFAGLSHYPVPAGRRDGRTTKGIESVHNLPSPFSKAGSLIRKFASKGFTIQEMVVLLGGHSIGRAHCSSFANRLYNHTGDPNVETQDPDLDKYYAEYLKTRCPKHDNLLMEFLSKFDLTAKVPFDGRTHRRLDVEYYKGLLKGEGLLASDQALVNNWRTRAIVEALVEDPEGWAKQFEKAMVKLGALEVLVGNEGEIRKKCRFVNGENDD